MLILCSLSAPPAHFRRGFGAVRHQTKACLSSPAVQNHISIGTMAADVATLLSGGPAFEGLVFQLMQSDDAIRSQAEAAFELLKAHADALIGNFLVVLRQSASVEHRQFAAIMLRKVGAPIGIRRALVLI